MLVWWNAIKVKCWSNLRTRVVLIVKVIAGDKFKRKQSVARLVCISCLNEHKLSEQ